MPTPFESALLNLRLFELRREPVLREAREWFLRDFNPETFEELVALLGGERNASFRMVLGYWDMAASLVTTGAIDRDGLSRRAQRSLRDLQQDPSVARTAPPRDERTGLLQTPRSGGACRAGCRGDPRPPPRRLAGGGRHEARVQADHAPRPPPYLPYLPYLPALPPSALRQRQRHPRENRARRR